MAHKANTRDRQPLLFRAKCSTPCSTWSQVINSPSFLVRMNDLLHVSFGLPRLRLPVLDRSILMRSLKLHRRALILITLPIQFHLLCLISAMIMGEVGVFRRILEVVCYDEGLTLNTSAKHHIPQAKNIPYQPLLIKPIFSVLAHAEKTLFFKTSLPLFSDAIRHSK